MNNNIKIKQSNIQLFINRFYNFIYWFINNEIATPLLLIFLIIIFIILAPFYLIGNYFYRYYCRINF